MFGYDSVDIQIWIDLKKNKRDRAINTFYETEYFEGWDDIEDREHAISIIATETHIIEELKKKLKDALSPDEFK
ncbi:hypothetical protein ACMAY7_06165 [Rhodobacteraceae bacterium nBUS_24]